MKASKAVFDHQTQQLGEGRTKENWGKATKTYELIFSKNQTKIKVGEYFKYMSQSGWNDDLNLDNFLLPVDDMAVAETVNKKTEALKAVTELLQTASV